MTIVEVVEGFRQRRLSPVDLADALLAQIERTEPALNAFVVRAEPSDIRAQAEVAARRWQKGEPLGVLDGVPITVKDAIHCTPWPVRVGSRTTSPAPCETDAPAVARAKEAGAIVLGKTTTPEFGWKAVTDSPLTGISRNPWNADKTPGGSSGGAAAAVAAGAAIASIGTDAAGSVRIPGSFCGLVALKASRGRVPAFPPSSVWTSGYIGPITRSVRDTALMLDVMAQPDARDWNSLPPPTERYAEALGAQADVKGLRIAFSPTLGHAKVDPQVAARVADAARRLGLLGANVEEVAAPLPDARAAFETYFLTGVSHSLRRFGDKELAQIEPRLAQAFEKGRGISREQFLEAYEFQIRIGREARLFHQSYDLLVTPTLAVPAFTAGELSPPGYDPENWLDWSPFTYPFNLSGQPAITVNCGFTAEGLPVGLQIVGNIYDEAKVLRAALAYEQSRPFEPRRPACMA